MSDAHTPAEIPQDDSVSMAQSVAVAVASALIMFTVVGLIASHGALSGPRADITPSVFAMSLPAQQATNEYSMTSQAAARVRLEQPTGSSGFAVTVPARHSVVLDTGLPGTGSDGTSELVLPPLEPGHYVVNVGMHEVIVTAVAQ